MKKRMFLMLMMCGCIGLAACGSPAGSGSGTSEKVSESVSGTESDTDSDSQEENTTGLELMLPGDPDTFILLTPKDISEESQTQDFR